MSRSFPTGYQILPNSLPLLDRMNLDEFNIQEMAKLDIIWIESIADEVETLNNGAVVLFDMKEYV